ncbi:MULTISPECIES: ligand-gated channel protein [Cupriavidus]
MPASSRDGAAAGALHCLILAALMAGAGVLASPPAVAQTVPGNAAPGTAQRDYRVSAGALGTVLNEVAATAGIALSFAPDLVAGRHAPAVQGRLDADAALRQALSGSGLEAVRGGSGAYSLRRGAGSAAAVAAASARSAPVAPAAASGAEPQLQTVVVTASGYEQQIKEAPASISVITREQLGSKFYRDVVDALQDAPGVTVTGGGDRQDISLRGMGAKYTLILVDGKRQNSRETRTNSDSSGVEGGWTPPIEAIERIEVVRGPMSSLYGSDAMGGVINIITRKVAREWTGSVRLDSTLQQHAGSGNIYQGNVFLSGPLRQELLGLQLYGQSTHRNEDAILNGYRNRKAQNLTARLALTPSRSQDIVLEGNLSQQDYWQNQGMTVPYGQSCVRGVCTPNGGKTEYESNRVALSHTGRWGFGVSDSYVQHERFDNRTRDMQIANTVLNTTWTLPFGTAHTATFGAYYNKAGLHDGTGNQLATGIRNVDRYQWALFAEEEWRLHDRFALTGGLRMDRDQNYGSHWSPRLYGVWQASQAVSVKGGVSTGFRAPDLRNTVAGWGQVSRGGNMYGNPDLKPETSMTEELGVIYDAGRGLNGSLTVFNNDFKDKITRVACPLTVCTDGPNQFGANPTTYVNVDKANTRGVEAALTVPLAQAWSLAANYTFTDSEQKSGAYKGQPLNQMPRHLIHATLNWKPAGRFAGWARLNFRGNESQPVTGPSSSSRVAPSYTFVDLGGSWRFSRHATAFAGIYNLFDKTVGYDQFGYVEDGRRLWLSLKVGF